MLLRSLYKLFAKVLAGRLVLVMIKLISPNQSAFLKEKQLMDGETAVNEVLDLAQNFKKECFIFKVDFKKACDSVWRSFPRLYDEEGIYCISLIKMCQIHKGASSII